MDYKKLEMFENKLKLWRLLHAEFGKKTNMEQHCYPYCWRLENCGKIADFKVLGENLKTGKIEEVKGGAQIYYRPTSKADWQCVEFIRQA